MQRVVITGLGIWSCLGTSLEDVRYSLYIGKSGIVLDPVLKEMGFRSGLTGRVDLLTFSERVVPDRSAFAESLIRRVPNLEAAVETCWTSTPATWERYTGTPGGTAFGIRKKDATCYVHPRTPIPGLYLTGQNCGLYGVLDVSETALTTCREILGESTLNQMLER